VWIGEAASAVLREGQLARASPNGMRIVRGLAQAWPIPKCRKHGCVAVYNREYRYCGSIWSGVFKSTMVESGKYLEYCRRYVMMNPVRAGIVTQIKAYRWVWSDMPSENEVFLGFNPRGEGKVAQIGSGKIFGSVGFVVKWIDAMGFTAKRTVAHAVGDVGYSSHGWRLAKRESEAAAS